MSKLLYNTLLYALNLIPSHVKPKGCHVLFCKGIYSSVMMSTEDRIRARMICYEKLNCSLFLKLLASSGLCIWKCTVRMALLGTFTRLSQIPLSGAASSFSSFLDLSAANPLAQPISINAPIQSHNVLGSLPCSVRTSAYPELSVKVFLLVHPCRVHSIDACKVRC